MAYSDIIETIKELGFKNNLDGINNEYQFIDDNYHIIIIIESVEEDSLTTEIVNYYFYLCEGEKYIRHKMDDYLLINKLKEIFPHYFRKKIIQQILNV
jgi:hypothetical protein